MLRQLGQRIKWEDGAIAPFLFLTAGWNISSYAHGSHAHRVASADIAIFGAAKYGAAIFGIVPLALPPNPFIANRFNGAGPTNQVSDAVAIPTDFSAILTNASSMKAIEEIFGRIGSVLMGLARAEKPSLEAK